MGFFPCCLVLFPLLYSLEVNVRMTDGGTCRRTVQEAQLPPRKKLVWGPLEFSWEDDLCKCMDNYQSGTHSQDAWELRERVHEMHGDLNTLLAVTGKFLRSVLCLVTTNVLELCDLARVPPTQSRDLGPRLLQ